MICLMRVPGAQCKITGPERAGIGWRARVNYAWSLHTVYGIVNDRMVWGLTRKSCQRRAERAVARFHLQEGPTPGPWTDKQMAEMAKIGGFTVERKP